MGYLELLLIAVGLSADAFAVSLCKGLCMKKINYSHAFIIALFFSFFQAAMPLLGWVAGRQFRQHIESFDHWIAFSLLALIGLKMLADAQKKNENPPECAVRLDIRELLILSVATSIDALAVGVTLSFLEVQILPAVSLIGLTTLFLSFIGVCIGSRFGVRFRQKAELAGGLILIFIGLKILFDHLGVLS
jgi:putative Mn2+ efflux pump MntP